MSLNYGDNECILLWSDECIAKCWFSDKFAIINKFSQFSVIYAGLWRLQNAKRDRDSWMIEYFIIIGVSFISYISLNQSVVCWQLKHCNKGWAPRSLISHITESFSKWKQFKWLNFISRMKWVQLTCSYNIDQSYIARSNIRLWLLNG